MSKGMDLFIEALQENQRECQNLIGQNNKDKAFIRFMQYLLFLFPIREKLALTDTENTKGKIKQDTVFGALKNYYEAIKHKDDPDEIYKTNILTSGGYTYPKTYPLVYTAPTLIFGDATEIAKFRTSPDSKASMITLHDKYLKGKTITSIMTFATTETIKVYTETKGATE